MDKTLKKVGRGVNKVSKTATSAAKAVASPVLNMKKCVVEGVLVLLLAVYSGVVVNFCPISYLEFFENIIVKIVFLVVIAFVGLYSPSVALFLAIALIVNLQMAQKKKISRDLDVLSTGNTSPKVMESMVPSGVPSNTDTTESMPLNDMMVGQEGDMMQQENGMMMGQEGDMMQQENGMMMGKEGDMMQQENGMESFTNNNSGPMGYNNDSSCVQSCQDTDAKGGNLSGQCGVVKSWDNQISAQGLECPPGYSDSVGAPF